MTNIYFNQKMQKLMSMAWTLVKTFNFNMADAMKLSWKVFKLRQKMHSETVAFTYRKKDGSIREAVGTTSMDIMPKDASTFTGGRSYSPMQIRYYDVESTGWRSFSAENLL